MELIESLQNIGLNDKEARGYLALLPLRRATAYMIALRSGLKKPTAYVVLESLVNKGFASKIPFDDKTFYVAKSPKECMSIARSKLQAAQEMLPELLALENNSDDKVNTSYFEGLDGVKEMYNRMIKYMKNKPEDQKWVVGFYAHQQDTSEMLQKYWVDMNNSLRLNKIKRKAVTTKHETLMSFLENENLKKNLITIKALPQEDYFSNISIEIYGNYTQIISHRYIQGILIENPDVAKVLQQIFNIVWKKRKEKPLG